MLEIIYVFVAAFSLGFIYSMYTRRTTSAKTIKERHIAAICGSILYLFGAIIVISYVGNHWMLIPAIAGDYLGTFLQITIDVNK